MPQQPLLVQPAHQARPSPDAATTHPPQRDYGSNPHWAAQSPALANGWCYQPPLFAPGVGEQIVAVDSTSRWPEPATALPSTGAFRSLAAEGVLALLPALVVLDEQAGRSAGV